MSILDNRYLVVKESPEYRRTSIFDLDGNFVKSFRTKHSVFGLVALKNNIVAIYENAGRDSKDEIISIADVYTYDIKRKKRYPICHRRYNEIHSSRKLHAFAISLFREGVFIARTKDGNLVVGFSHSSKIDVYSPYGQKLKTIDLGNAKLRVTEEKNFYVHLEDLAGGGESIQAIGKGSPVFVFYRSGFRFFAQVLVFTKRSQ